MESNAVRGGRAGCVCVDGAWGIWHAPTHGFTERAGAGGGRGGEWTASRKLQERAECNAHARQGGDRAHHAQTKEGEKRDNRSSTLTKKRNKNVPHDDA